MERTPFAIDDAKDDEDESDEEPDDMGDDDQVLDEVYCYSDLAHWGDQLLTWPICTGGCVPRGP